MVLVADLTARVNTDTDQANRGILGYSQNLVGMAGQAGLAVFGIGQLVGALASTVTGFLGGAAEMERYETQLTTLMGSATLAKDRLAELAVFGASTPFELPELVQAEKVLQGFGLTGQKALDMTGMAYEDFFTRVGDISAGVGRPFEEIALTFGKFSAGATGEAISRLQELGVATKEQMAAMGVEFDKAGSLVSPLPVAMQAVMAITEGKFKGGMDKLSNTFEGRMSTLSDAWGGLMRTLGTPVLAVAGPVVQKLSDFLGGPVTENAEKLGPIFEQAMGAVASSIEGAAPYIQIGKDAIQTFQEAMAGDWTSGEGINPLVNSIGLFATSLRNDVLPAATQFSDWFASEARPVIDPIVAQIMQVASVVLPMLGAGFRSAIEQAGPFAAMLIGQLRPAMESVGQFIQGTLVPGFNTIAAIVGPVFMTAFGQMGEMFANLGSQFGAMGPEVAELGAALAPLLPVLGGIAAIVGGVLVAGFASAWAAISGLLTGIPTVIRGIIVGITDILNGTTAIAQNWMALLQALIHGDFAGVWSAAAGMVDGFKQVFSGILSALSGIVLGVFLGISTAVINTLQQMVPGASDQLQSLKNAIIEKVQSIDLRALAGAMIQGMIDGIASKFPAVAAVLGTLRGLFPSSPAKWGPWSELPEWSSAFDSMSPALSGALNASEGGLSSLRDLFGDAISEIQSTSLAEDVEDAMREVREVLAQGAQVSIAPLQAEAGSIPTSSPPIAAGIVAPGAGGGTATATRIVELTTNIDIHDNRFGLGPDQNLTEEDVRRIVTLITPAVAVEVAKLIGEDDD